MRIESEKQLRDYRKKLVDADRKLTKKIMVCHGPGCLASGSEQISEEFTKQLAKKRIAGVTVEAVKKTGCHSFCEKSPLVAIEPAQILYTKVKVKDVAEIIEKSVAGDEVIERLVYHDPHSNEAIATYPDVPFYKYQTRLALRNLGKINACDIDDYIRVGGYDGAAKALLHMTPENVIDEITKSNLRGRGGGGFPAGRKWASCRAVESDVRYVVCNGDEGDPGAFMDRAIMEGDPHTVLEGMVVAAFAVGANDGYIYVREEYPLAVINLQKAIEQAEGLGLLGDNILGTGFSLRIHINRGAGAFVCGESSALMLSVAGNVGEPRAKYVRSVVKGLWDKPTVLNNVETYANVPLIITNGAEWFTSIGAPKNAGTKAFSLVGKVRHTGLIEVPMGTTLRRIVFDIGGGLLKDRPFKGVQTGGPSGGCLAEKHLDLSVDFDTLTTHGSMMGSGGMIVMDDRTCMVDVAKYFLSFLVSESCGKCIPCREGLYQLHKLAIAISEGRGTEQDIEKMERLSEMVVLGSLCGLGKSGPNPFLSTISNFRDEYLAHIRDHRCPAGVCRELITYEINPEKCDGCMACISACAVHAITGRKTKPHVINQELCTKCGACVAACTRDAIAVF
ncbi:MAG: NADH-ubiquinone oxidoreductase-F iron-sulfur binding region domain-containing protein [candidate division Zixibacteria bacterium]|jgi:NADH-quinone oxidoreductase subunit F|nr:NADH-ubiquinone oxidoreductase-F iron-sulfur binding region domain-containing protein [candidate division Zixibacteria bacterium]